MHDLIRRTRREFLTSSASGVGGLALAHLVATNRIKAADRKPSHPTAAGGVKTPHIEPTARACIFVFLAGGPSQLDLFVHRPRLRDPGVAGQPLPASMTEEARFAFIRPDAECLPSPWSFQRHGESRMWFSELLPHIADYADDICMIHSMQTDAVNHHPGQLLMNTGHQQFGHPALGAWINYGLGSVADNLPGYIVLTAGDPASGGATNWSNGFLPSIYQGLVVRSSGPAVLNLKDAPGITPAVRQRTLEAAVALNRRRFNRVADPRIHDSIATSEMAFRMQVGAMDLNDLSDETAATLRSYGVHRSDPAQQAFSKNCLMARRLVERGVRFVNLYHGRWDQHGDLRRNLVRHSEAVDQPIAALLGDLKQRGLLDSTVVVCGTEFGRTPLAQGGDGRDHHPRAFATWMAGGGARGGLTWGRVDDFGWNVVEDPVHVHDFQATLLHMFGLDHRRLSVQRQGLETRLTGTGDTARVVHGLLT